MGMIRCCGCWGKLSFLGKKLSLVSTAVVDGKVLSSAKHFGFSTILLLPAPAPLCCGINF